MKNEKAFVAVIMKLHGGEFEDQTQRSHGKAPAVATETRTACSGLQDGPENMPDMDRGKSLRAP